MTNMIKYVFAAAILYWSVWDLTGSAAAGLMLALVPLGLGISNVMPFAAGALPVVALVAAVAARIWPELSLDLAASSLRENAHHAAQILAQRLAD